MDSKRDRIVKAVIARLEAIQTGAGYQTNVGEHVFYWRTGTMSEEELNGFSEHAALVVRDLDETKATDGDHTKITKLNTQKFSRDLHIQIEIVCGDEDAPTRLRKYIADIETAIGKDIRWRDVDTGQPLAIGTRPRIDRSVVEQESKKIGGVVYEFFIFYATDAFNPYQ